MARPFFSMDPAAAAGCPRSSEEVIGGNTGAAVTLPQGSPSFQHSAVTASAATMPAPASRTPPARPTAAGAATPAGVRGRPGLGDVAGPDGQAAAPSFSSTSAAGGVAASRAAAAAAASLAAGAAFLHPAAADSASHRSGDACDNFFNSCADDRETAAASLLHAASDSSDTAAAAAVAAAAALRCAEGGAGVVGTRMHQEGAALGGGGAAATQTFEVAAKGTPYEDASRRHRSSRPGEEAATAAAGKEAGAAAVKKAGAAPVNTADAAAVLSAPLVAAAAASLADDGGAVAAASGGVFAGEGREKNRNDCGSAAAGVDVEDAESVPGAGGAATEATTAADAAGDDDSSAVAAASSSALTAACAYCGASSPECLLRCCCCDKYFCNTPCSSGSSMGSHIVFHLVRSRHKEVMLHPEGPLGDCMLECFQCGTRNIFLLGLIPAESEGVVVLICREPCLSSNALKQSGWDLSQWQPLIEGKAFLPWLVRPLTAKERRSCRVASVQQLQRLEELWQRNPTATLGELDNIQKEEALPVVKLMYEDGYDYQRTFAPLVQAEANYDKQMKECQKLEKVKIRWELGLRRKRLAYFLFARDEGCNIRLAAGDEVRITTGLPKSLVSAASGCSSSGEKKAGGRGAAAAAEDGRGSISLQDSSSGSNAACVSDSCDGGGEAAGGEIVWSCTGSITRFAEDSEEVVVELKKPPATKGPWDTSVPLLYTIEFLWKSTSFERMQTALRQLAVDEISVSSYLYHTFMGRSLENQVVQIPMPTQICAPNLAPLNPSQMLAIRYALQHPLTLIQGPPGTGKTLTCSTLVYQMVKLSEAAGASSSKSSTKPISFNKEGGGQVLVAAPSNIAVDQLAERIHRTGLKVVRVYSKSREFSSSSSASAFCLEHLALHKNIHELQTSTSEEMAKYVKLKEHTGELAPADEKRLRQLVARAEMEILQTADVICTTCVGAGDNRLQGFRFRQVVIDEATQATEPECLIPIVLGAKQVVLIGDHCQLGPVMLNKKVAAAGLATSLFSRLLALGHRPLRLKVQYRMHPALSFFPSYFFYEGELQNGVTVKERTYAALQPGGANGASGGGSTSGGFPWPSRERPMFFYHSSAAEEISGSGTSYINRVEAANIEKIVTFLLKCGLKASQIGVITPYDGQRAHITSLFQRQSTLGQSAFSDLEVASVDAFQGREKDFILLSCVRSNNMTGIGFLADARRLNVALTRARYGLIICGNAAVLANYSPPPPRPPAAAAVSTAGLLAQQQQQQTSAAATAGGGGGANDAVAGGRGGVSPWGSLQQQQLVGAAGVGAASGGGAGGGGSSQLLWDPAGGACAAARAAPTAADAAAAIACVPEPPIWRLLIHHFLRYDLVVDGPLSNLKPTRLHVKLPPLSSYYGSPFYAGSAQQALAMSRAAAEAGAAGSKKEAAQNKVKRKGTTRHEVTEEELQDYSRSLPQAYATPPTALPASAAVPSPGALYPSPACAALLSAERGFQPFPTSSSSSFGFASSQAENLYLLNSAGNAFSAQASLTGAGGGAAHGTEEGAAALQQQQQQQHWQQQQQWQQASPLAYSRLANVASYYGAPAAALFPGAADTTRSSAAAAAVAAVDAAADQLHALSLGRQSKVNVSLSLPTAAANHKSRLGAAAGEAAGDTRTSSANRGAGKQKKRTTARLPQQTLAAAAGAALREGVQQDDDSFTFVGSQVGF